MKSIQIALIVGLSFVPLFAHAQMSSSSVNPQANSSSSPMVEDPSPNTPEWQLTLDVIRVKSETLVGKNNKLTAEEQAMEAQYSQLQASVNEMKQKNDELRQYLKERHGRSDQQNHIDELVAQVKAKEAENKGLQKQMQLLQGESSSLEQKLRLKRLKIEDARLKRNAQALENNEYKAVKDRSLIDRDEEFNRLKRNLADEQQKESDLENQLKMSKKVQAQESAPQPVDETRMKLLRDHLENLRQENKDLQKHVNVDNNQSKIKRYDDLILKKKTLEAKIKDFETQLDEFKDPGALASLTNPRRKETLRQMIEWDNKNARMRQKISSLREDLVLLRQQVTRLERKLKSTN